MTLQLNKRSMVLLASALLAVLLPLSASAERVTTVRPGPEAAQIIGSPGWPNRDLFAVKFIEINGQNIPSRDIMWLKPGTYRIKVAILARHTRPPMSYPPSDSDPDYNVIELELEAGKTYHIRGRFNRDNPEAAYSTIVYKVEERAAS